MQAVTVHATNNYFVTASLDSTWCFYDISSGLCLTQVTILSHACHSFIDEVSKLKKNYFCAVTEIRLKLTVIISIPFVDTSKFLLLFRLRILQRLRVTHLWHFILMVSSLEQAPRRLLSKFGM